MQASIFLSTCVGGGNKKSPSNEKNPAFGKKLAFESIQTAGSLFSGSLMRTGTDAYLINAMYIPLKRSLILFFLAAAKIYFV